MRIRGLGRLRRSWQAGLSLWRPSAVILLYHRVFEAETDPQQLCVQPDRFAEQLAYLKRRYQIISLKDLVQALQAGDLPKQAVVITFDDGYADNLHEAKPLLERYDLPATVFVTSGYIGQNREFYWDELDRLLLQPGQLPERLSLKLNGNNYSWDLATVSDYTEEHYQIHCSWNVLEKDDPTLRQHLYRFLFQAIRQLSEVSQREVLDDLREQIGRPSTGRSSHRALTSDEVIELADGGLIEIGAHTVTHPSLAALPVGIQQSEIQQSKTQLEEILGFPINSFSYPYGSHSDYTGDTVAIVRESRFTRACANFANLVWQKHDPFQLPRILVRNWDGETFARQLWSYLPG